MNIQQIITTEHQPWQSRTLAPAAAWSSCNLETTGIRHQTIKGCGGCFNELGYTALQNAAPDQRQQVMQALFGDNGCRFNFCRLPIGASDYALDWYSCNETDGDLAMQHFSVARDERYLIPYIKLAQQVCGAIEFFASPWSPPTWMKTHRVCNHGTLRWEKPILEAYALYFQKFVQAYQARGINVTQIHVQNEPMSDQKFPSCVWQGEQMREFIADYLGPHFEKHQVPVEVWLGTINGPEYDGRWAWTRFDQFANNVLSCPKASKYTKGVAYQWAGKYALQQTHNAYPHVPMIQSENECGDGSNNWRYAHYIWELMQHYFTNNVIAYVYWNMVLATGGNSTWGWKQNSMVTIDPQNGAVKYEHEFYLMKHLARFVKPGAVRLGLKGPWTSNALCFQNPDGSTVLVMANPFANARKLNCKLANTSFDVDLEPSSFHTFVMP